MNNENLSNKSNKYNDQNDLFIKVIDFFFGAIFFTLIFIIIAAFSGKTEFINQLKTHYVSIDNQGEITLTETAPPSWSNLKDISKTAVQAVIISEDWSFYKHQGIDYKQISNALMDTINEGKKLRGASTISQQVIKNLFFTNERSYFRKINEAWITKTLETKLSKNRILEIYINIVELGKNIYGITNASWYYFRKHPRYLTPKEGAFLAMLLPSPRRYAVSFTKKQLTKYAKKRVNTILKYMMFKKVISKETYDTELNTPFFWEEESLNLTP